MNLSRPWRSPFATGRSPASCARGLVVSVVAAAIAGLAPVILTAQTPDSGGFVILVGAADTLATEIYTRRPDGVSGELIGPTLGRLVYDVAIHPDAMMGDLTIEFWTPGTPTDGAPNQAATIAIERDTVVVRITTPPGIQAQRLPTRTGAFPYINPSFLQIEQMVRRARVMGGEVAEFPVLLALGQETINARVVNASSDSVTIMIGSEIHAIVDGEGRLRSASLPYQGLTIVRME